MNNSHNARRMEASVRKKITYSTGLVDISSKIDYLLPGQTCSSVKHNNFASYKMLLYHCLEELIPLKFLKKKRTSETWKTQRICRIRMRSICYLGKWWIQSKVTMEERSLQFIFK